MTQRVLGITGVLAGVAMTALGIGLIALTPTASVPVGHRVEEVVAYLILQVSFSGMAAVLVSRRPDHPMTRVITLAALLSASQFLFAGYAVYGVFGPGLPGAEIGAWLYTWTGVSQGLSAGLIVATFPEGRALARSSRAAIAALVIGVGLLGAVLAFRPGPLGNLPAVSNPFGWSSHGGILGLVEATGLVFALFALVLAVRRLVDRGRRGSGVERQQLKWLMWSCGILALTLVIGFPLVLGPPDVGVADAVGRYVGRVAIAMAMATLPLSIGLAVLRYRLYDIDVLIHRTIVYTIVSGALATTYVAGVVVFHSILRPLTGGSELGVAVTTLIVVALFQPFRRRVQDLVDRRFYRSRYNAARTLDSFMARLRNDVDIDNVRSDLLDVVGETVRPAHASVWLRAPGRRSAPE